jgi:hypothetical protein
MALHARVLEVSASPAEMQDYFEAQGFTDGLPVVPPTADLVSAMIDASGLAGEAELAVIAPSQVMATVEKVAINAVMAGCRPAYMPVVVAALRAITQPAWNLAGVQATTHVAAPVIFVNGPIRQRIGLNSGSNVFGQGFRANATIGRAVRLVLMNIGQGIPAKTDMATFGTPCKFTFCGGENEEQSPWTPYHVDHGMDNDDSAVMVHAGEGPHNMQDHGSRTADELLMTIADTMNITGNNNAGLGGEMVVVLGPEHARILAGDGMSKDDVRQELHRRLRLDLSRFGSGLRAWYRKRRPATDVGPEITEIPYFDDWRQILVMVAGGPGLHSMIIPSFGGMSRSTIERIATAA